MVSLIQGLRQKLTAASSSLRSPPQTDVNSASHDELMSEQTRAVVKAFKLQSAAELKVLVYISYGQNSSSAGQGIDRGQLLLGSLECLDSVRMRVQIGRHWRERVCQSSLRLYVAFSTRISDSPTYPERKYHSAAQVVLWQPLLELLFCHPSEHVLAVPLSVFDADKLAGTCLVMMAKPCMWCSWGPSICET